MKVTRFLFLLATMLFVVIGTSEVTAQNKRKKAKKEHKTVKKDYKKTKKDYKNEKRHRKTQRKYRRTHKHRRVHYHYRHQPRWGFRVNIVPRGGAYVSFGGVRYTYVNGVYYKPVRDSYVVVGAPIGVRVKVLPPRHTKIVLTTSPAPYYYYYGTYYVEVDSRKSKEYVAVKPPLGAKVNALPDGYKTVVISGETHYILNDTYYKEIITGDNSNDVYYEVVSE